MNLVNSSTMLQLYNTKTKAGTTATIPFERSPAEQLRRQLLAVAGEVHKLPEERKTNLDRLLRLMSELPAIKRCSEEECFNESLQGFAKNVGTFLEGANIETLDAEETLTATVKYFNGILRNKKKDYYRQIKRNSTFTIAGTKETGKILSIDLPVGRGEGKKYTVEDSVADQRLSSGWEWIETEENKLRHEDLKAYLRTDPEGILQSYHPKGYPQANFWELVKRQMLRETPQSWQDICQELEVKFGTITAYSHRHLSLVLQWVFIQKIDKQHGSKWWEFIEVDAGGVLRGKKLDGCPECDGREVAKGLLLPEDKPGKMGAIARRFQVLTKDVEDFWKTQCLPCFIDII